MKTALAGLLFTILPVVSTASFAREKIVTCNKLVAVDGDTIRCDGLRMRDMGDGEPFKSGYDTPEIRNSKCDAEKALGRKAKKRMAELLTTRGLTITDSGEVESRHNRPLVWIKLPSGKTVGAVLIEEGLARRWTPEYEPDWCR